MKIKTDHIIAEIFDRWPQTVPVFLRHRMGCVGCSMADFEPLYRALEIYELPLDPFLEELHDTLD